MIEPALSPDEPIRLNSLRALGVLDTPLEERFERITRLAQKLLSAPIAGISLVEADRQWFKSVQGWNVEQTSRAISFCGHTILQNHPMSVPDARTDPRFCDNPLVTGPSGVVFYFGCPVRAPDGTHAGALCVIDRVPRRPTLDEERTLLDLASMAEQELACFSSSRPMRELVAQADVRQTRTDVDPLTRLWNRDATFELVHIGLRHARARSGVAAIAIVDIDGFARLNLEHGREVGDELLRQMAKRLLGSVRAVDAVGRFGSDRFVVVLGDCDSETEALRVTHALRVRIAQTAFATGRASIPVTASLGVRVCTDPGSTTDAAMLHDADAALKRAKASGGDRVEVFRGEPRLEATAA